MSELKTDKISPRTASGTITLGDSGDTFTVPSGVTLTNNGTATGFSEPAYAANASASTGAVNVDASDNLQFDSGYGSTATAYGCRAWVNFNGTGTLSIRSSGNVSSVTDVSTGRYQMNFSTSPPDANYCAVASKRNETTNTGFACQTPQVTASYVEIQTYENSNLTDSSIVSCAVFR